MYFSAFRKSRLTRASPAHFLLPAQQTLTHLWEIRRDSYRLIRWKRSTQRKGMLKRMVEKAIVAIPESPCASAFSSLNSAASGSSTDGKRGAKVSSFAAARDAARAELGRAGAEAFFGLH